MISKLFTCLWFHGNAHEAADYYSQLFDDAEILGKNNYVAMLSIQGTKIMCLNGGPHYKHTQAFSQFITCETDEEIDRLWNSLSMDGIVRMSLGKYDWSEYYGWCDDRYGVSWQIYKGKMEDVKQKIVPCLLFVDKRFGQAEQAVKFYASVFANTTIDGILKYESTNTPMDGTVMHAQYRINNSVFMAMDGYGEHHFDFSPACSIVIECETQEEIDYYWTTLGEGGKYNKCGWLDDKYGVSWQIVPKILGALMSDQDRAPRVVEAFLKMSKFDIKTLLEA